MTSSVMTVFIEQADPNAADAKAPGGKTADPKAPKPKAAGAPGPSENSGVRRMEAEGPVTVISKT